ncbi:MAG TPA: putative sulfate exporter family transporter, partial [Polyangiaceae bacterium]|nr:putative sulfate exporter family transporter [Polyangiaceae bacterium]
MPRRAVRPQWLPARGDYAGIALALGIGGFAVLVTRLLPPSPLLSDVLLALAFGAVVTNVGPLRRLVGLAAPGEEREADRYATGLRFVGKWVLRLSIILMGLKLQAKLFGASELLVLGMVAGASIPSAFFVAHAVAAPLGVRRPLGDLLAGGTMICGASAVNALAPVVGARREEQGVAIGAVFLFSVVALVAFHPIATLVGLDAAHAGLWSGLAVNDLSSAVAVGQQMGEAGGTMAAAAKSSRIVLMAPMLVVLSLVRRRAAPGADVGKRALDQLPGFLLGYVGLAVARAVVDRVAPASTAVAAVLDGNRLVVDVLMATVTASIGLHLAGSRLLASGWRALAVGGVTAAWMAGLTLAMVTLAARGAVTAGALLGGACLVAAGLAYRAKAGPRADVRLVKERYAAGTELTVAEASLLLDRLDHEGHLDDDALRRVLHLLQPSIGELIPVRASPLHHGVGCRWATFWEGASGWALVAVCRDPGSATPIHAHPHRLLGKSIEGMLEELRFDVVADGRLRLVERKALTHGDLVETDGLATPHLVRALGD